MISGFSELDSEQGYMTIILEKLEYLENSTTITVAHKSRTITLFENV